MNQHTRQRAWAVSHAGNLTNRIGFRADEDLIIGA